MQEESEKISLLQARLETLMQKQEVFRSEINQLRNELTALKSTTISQPIPEKAPVEVRQSIEPIKEPFIIPEPKRKWESKELDAIKSDLEKYIGENLINKIGILIIIIGVVIGAKYAIDKDLISPLTRIIMAYMLGAALLVLAIKLKSKYENFSAVLLGGAMAIFYFVSFAAYSYYNLLGLPATFALMVFFTIFTVFASLNYNRQVIAHFGLVAAYAVPFLVSDKSGNISNLFTYMLIINTGILVIAIKKLWKPLFYLAFASSWLIFSTWFVADFDAEKHFTIALTFSTLFFIVFYAVFLVYKIIQNEKFKELDIVILLLNSFIFYAINYVAFNDREITQNFLGLFTIGNAAIHFMVSLILYKRKLGDTNLLNFVSGLVLVFITVTIPVQLSGGWITALWAAEAALLFWIGRTKQVLFYELISYPLIILAFLSLLDDWTSSVFIYNAEEQLQHFTPFINTRFLVGLFFIAAFLLINLIHNKEKYLTEQVKTNSFFSLINFALPAILIFTTYFSIRMELSDYWLFNYNESKIIIQNPSDSYPDIFYNYNLLIISKIWIINYSLIFLVILSYLNIKRIKNEDLGFINIVLNALAILVFLTQGLYSLSLLRDSYIDQTLAEYYHRGSFLVSIRYISYLFLAMLLVITYTYTKQDFIKKNLKIYYALLLHISILWVASSELINLMDLLKSDQSYKLGLSILWGVYALVLVAIGIYKRAKYLRIGGITLFSITLLKLFLYDLSDLDNIAKTIVFVSLGILLLIISFLYNKYKHYLKDEN